MPHQIVQRQRLLQFDLVLPAPLPPGDFNVPLGVAEDVVFRIKDFDRQLSSPSAVSMVGNSKMQ
jgi:hypothetical protein